MIFPSVYISAYFYRYLLSYKDNMSQIVKDVRRNKMKRPKAAGEGDQSERGAPRKTFSDVPSRSNNVSIRSRQHQRRSSDISNDHGFSPPKDNDGKVEFHVSSNRNNVSNDRKYDNLFQLKRN